jgi:AraC family transcriptional regulator
MQRWRRAEEREDVLLVSRELVFDLKAGKTRPAVSQSPALCSANGPWKGFFLELHSIPGAEVQDVFFLNHVIGVHLGDPAQLELKYDGHSRTHTMRAGESNVLPSNLPFSARCEGRSDFLMISLDPRFLACAAHEIGSQNRLEVAPQVGLNDPLIHGLALALKAEVESGESNGPLYAETLATTLAVHVARKYSGQTLRCREESSGLAKYQLRRAIDFIHDHLSEDISLKAIADAVGISPFHFSRLFKRSTGTSPHQYLLRCRTERAKQLLLQSSESIADVALRLGFCDQSHMTTHFKRAYGVTPKAFLRNAVVLGN